MLFDFSTIGETQAALLSAIFGGAGVKILEKLISRHSDKFNEAEKIRSELRGELEIAKKEVEDRKAEADEWREKYWHQVQLATEYLSEIEKLKNDVAGQSPLSGSI
jgi:peptidoglycan hydrolase CwlO-like protein